MLAFSCVLGYVVAKISRKLKRQSLITVFLSLLFMIGYYVVYAKAQQWFTVFLENAQYYGAVFRRIYPLYIFGRAGHAAEHGVDFRVAKPYGGIAFSQLELDERDRSHQAKRQCAFNAVWRYWIYIANGWRIFSAWLRNRRHGVFGAAVLCERGAGCGAVSMAL